MKKISIFICLALLMAIGFIECATHKTSAYSNYETLIIGTELDGSYTLRVCGKARNSVDAYVQAGKQAVKDVLFKNLFFTNTKDSPLKPLLLTPNAEQKYEDYFNAFFADGGAYRDFTSLHDTRIITENWNNNKLQVLVQVSVTVDRKALKQKLIDDNILKTY